MPQFLDRWTHGRVPIGLRWWITRSGELRTGWPAPGLESTALAMGWIAERTPMGVIELPAPPIDTGLLDILDDRFPNRRWYAGEWDQSEQASRQAA